MIYFVKRIGHIVLIITIISLIMISILFAQIVVFSTAILIIVTYYYASILNKNMWYQALNDARKDYQSPEMMNAIQNLYIFYNKNRSNFTDRYKKIEKQEKKKIKNGTLKRTDSLSYQRRLVFLFYIKLYDVYRYGMLRKDILFSFWHKNVLEIIPDIIKPLEIAQTEIDGTDLEQTKRLLAKLQELYDHSR